MSNVNPVFQGAMDRCKSNNAADVNSLLSDVQREKFLQSLDDIRFYQERRTPPNISEVLDCLAQSSVVPDMEKSLVALASRKEYSAEDGDGSLRRNAVIESLGMLPAPGNDAINFLNKELENGKYLASTVATLAEIANTASIAVLRDRVYGTQNSVLKAHNRDSYLRNTTYELAKYRDRLPVMNFLLNEVYNTDLKRAVIECVAQDSIELAPDPEFHITFAPLTAKTGNAIELSKAIGQWFYRNANLLSFTHAFEPSANKITDLLGIPASAPASTEPDDIKKWFGKIYTYARDIERDATRKKEINDALNDLIKL